jgi:hypothetical protein
MRLAGPGRSELGPESDDEQHWGVADALDDPAQCLEARRIHPMCVLEDHEDGLTACQSRELRCQGFQRPLSALLRHERERRIATIVGKRQQFGKECDIRIRGRSLRQHGIELVQLRACIILMREARGALQLTNDGIERAVGVLRRAEVAQASVGFTPEPFQKRGGEPRFADAGLPRNQDDLAFAAPCSLPAAEQDLELLLTPDQGGQTLAMQRFEAALDHTGSDCCPGPNRSGETLETVRAKVFKLEQGAEQPPRALANDDSVRFGDALQPRRQVRRLAKDTALLRIAGPDQIADHHEPGRNPRADLERPGSARLQPRHRADDVEPGPHRPLGVVLVRMRIAEVDQHAVAHVFRHKPVEAAHRLGDTLLIGRDDLSQVLRVHVGGECCRTDQVGKHHRNLAALGGIDVSPVRWRKIIRRRRLGGCNTAQGGDSVQQLATVSDNFDAEILQVLRR